MGTGMMGEIAGWRSWMLGREIAGDKPLYPEPDSEAAEKVGCNVFLKGRSFSCADLSPLFLLSRAAFRPQGIRCFDFFSCHPGPGARESG